MEVTSDDPTMGRDSQWSMFIICFKFIYCFHYALNSFIAFYYALNTIIDFRYALNTFIAFHYALNTFIVFHYAINTFITFIYIYYVFVIISFPRVIWIWKSLAVLANYVKPSMALITM